MDPRILDLYNEELEQLRSETAEFAREYPDAAKRLSLDEKKVEDPYVERLLEGVAFLAARVRLKLEAQYPIFTQQLLEVLFPSWSAPTPSAAVFQLRVDAAQSHTSTRTTVIYVTLLVVFLSTLITGVIITARLIWHETRLSRLKTDFVSHMSHELRTPLTSIRMFIETLKIGKATSPEEQAECLALLAKETERLTDMIERVLGYARLKAGRRLFAPSAVPAARIVEDAIDAFRAQNLDIEHGGSAPVKLVTEIASALPPVFADRDALVEALLNLIMNAYKYTDADKQITVFAREGRRGRILLGVQDNGPGVPKNEHRRVFERFYQGGHLLSTKQPGSGLGLAITQAIVEGNGGRITLESEPGAGARFTIELRRAS